jgi:hypothetical protein
VCVCVHTNHVREETNETEALLTVIIELPASSRCRQIKSNPQIFWVARFRQNSCTASHKADDTK